jgi:dTDP-4-dehydrorhamnose 3,5-epimerase-like enzyme
MQANPPGPLERVKLMDLPGNPEGARQLTFLELGKHSPFPVTRVYWIHTLSAAELRGQHAHRTTQQLLVAVGGRIQISLDDGFSKREYLLESPTHCLYVPAGLWRDITILEDRSVLLALASTYFDEADYIRDYDEYLRYVRNGRKDDV